MTAEWVCMFPGAQEEEEEVGDVDQDGAGFMEDGGKNEGQDDKKADFKLPTDYHFMPRSV